VVCLDHMRTTVRLEDGLLEQAKREARRRGQTLTSLIDQGLRLALGAAPSAVHTRRSSCCRFKTDRRRDAGS